jgi:hypothetical protein
MGSSRRYNDKNLVDRVREEYSSGRAQSYGAAALSLALAGQIPGGGTPQSKAKRIAVKASKLDKALKKSRPEKSNI